jgi:hypothetical protein
MKRTILIYISLLSNCFAIDPFTVQLTGNSLSKNTEICNAVINKAASRIAGEFKITEQDRITFCYKLIKQKNINKFNQKILGLIKSKFKIVDLSDLVGSWRVNAGASIMSEVILENGDTYLMSDDETIPAMHLGKYVEGGESIMLIPASSYEDISVYRASRNSDGQYVLYNHKAKMRLVFEEKLN